MRTLKEPNRKAVFRSHGGPQRVLLPFLAEDRPLAGPRAYDPYDPQIGDWFRISEVASGMQGPSGEKFTPQGLKSPKRSNSRLRNVWFSTIGGVAPAGLK